MTELKLRWVVSNEGRREDLYVGSLPAAIAFLEKRTKWWEGWVWLEGSYLSKKYGTCEIMKPQIEMLVRLWFNSALTDRIDDDKDRI